MALYYVAHRLFAAHDRALGARAAERLARKAGMNAVFLPFCDTDEEDLIDECKGRRLFDMDCERLGRIDGMIAICTALAWTTEYAWKSDLLLRAARRS